MTTSESESDDEMDTMYDDTMCGDYDDFCEYDDIARLESVRDSILGTTTMELRNAPSIDIPSNYTVHLAMNSKPEVSNNLRAPPAAVNDSLRMYLIAPPLVRRTVDTLKPCLSIDPTIDDYQSTTLSTPELYVGNLPNSTTQAELKHWFTNDTGHNVSRVEVKTNRVRICHC